MTDEFQPGGSYRNENGKITRLDQPQKPNLGKNHARNRAVIKQRKAERKAAEKSEAEKPDESNADKSGKSKEK